MRQIIIDYARRRQAQKRGGGAAHVTLDASVLGERDAAVEALELEAALSQLSTMEPGLAQLVELRVFAGLTIQESAEVLGVSTRTIDRRWLKACVLLKLIMAEDEDL